MVFAKLLTLLDKFFPKNFRRKCFFWRNVHVLSLMFSLHVLYETSVYLSF